MKKLAAVVLAATLASCTVARPSVGVGGYAYETSQAVVVATTDKGTEQVHLALTGANDAFKPSVDAAVGTCKVTSEKDNIWNCDLGKIAKGEIKTVAFEGKLLSGNLFAYEQGTNRIIFDIVKVK